jgi:hypothetical protein
MIERLPRRIVRRRPEELVIDLARRPVEARMPPRHHEVHARIGELGERQLHRVHVAVDVVDPEDGLPGRQRERLRHRDPDQERPHQPGSARHRQGVDRPEPDLRVRERLLDDRVDRLDVRPAGDFGHDPAVHPVDVDLGLDDVGEDLATIGNDRRGGLVAGGFDPEDQQGASNSRKACPS